MDTFTINNVLTKAMGPTVFKGVFPASDLPPVGNSNKVGRVVYPFCFVANTDCCHKSGDHWVAFYFDKEGKARYFDSFGRLPMYRDWINYMTGMSKEGLWYYNKACIQSQQSGACGEYCIYYLLKRHSTPLTVDDYTLMNNVTENDACSLVKKYMTRNDICSFVNKLK